MIESDLVLKLCSTDDTPDYRLVFSQELLHPVHDEIYIHAINNILLELQQLAKGTFDFKKQKKKDCVTIYYYVERLKKLENFDRLLNHPVKINEFKKSTDTSFIQARANIKDQENDLTKRFCLYVGNSKEFPKGSLSIEAYQKGRNLIRRSLEPFYKIEINK